MEEGGAGMGLGNAASEVAPAEPAAASAGDSLQKQGFVVSSVDAVMNWARTGSMWPMTFGLACCAVEMIHSKYCHTTFSVMRLVPFFVNACTALSIAS